MIIYLYAIQCKAVSSFKIWQPSAKYKIAYILMLEYHLIIHFIKTDG